MIYSKDSRQVGVSREPTISVRLLKVNITVYEKLYKSYDYDLLKLKYGVCKEDLTDDDYRVPLIITNDIIHQVSQKTGDPVLGLNWHNHTDLPINPAIVRCISNAPDINSALQIIMRYLHLVTEMGDFELQAGQESGSLTFTPYDESLVNYHQVDAMLFGFHRIAKGLRGGGLTSVSFRHSCPPGCEEIYSKAFNIPVFFDQPYSMLSFSSNWLKARVGVDRISIDDLVLSEKNRAMLNPEISFSAQIENIIKLMLSFGEPSREDVAKAWGMSLRSFQRSLSNIGTSYQKLLNKVRLELAYHYLTQLAFSCEEIAFLLGYSEARSFYHAFKGWAGVTPSKYRRATLL
ncbi:MAG: AraC family transcriptional regulator ligand-binding domain-containing protein [Oleispira sp.]